MRRLVTCSRVGASRACNDLPLAAGADDEDVFVAGDCSRALWLGGNATLWWWMKAWPPRKHNDRRAITNRRPWVVVEGEA